ncbi:hypothetical protein D1871_15620 [Nakamurella silvestris]|nr:hypothetical protein D1871_15620 [Nakamurella silvestris]
MSDNPVLITLAPTALPLPELLRAAIDAERVGAARIHLGPDVSDLDHVVASIREHTSLIVTSSAKDSTADGFGAAPEPVNQGSITFSAQTFIAAGVDLDSSAQWFELRFDGTMTPTQVVLQTGVLATRFEAPLTVAGDGEAGMPAQLAAIAAGYHLRVGSSHTPLVAGSAGPRDDAGLVARAAGIARLAGRLPMTVEQAREFLGI